MAYSNTPVISTYSTLRIPPVYDLDLNPGYPVTDSYMENLVPRKIGQKVVAENRYCISAKWASPINVVNPFNGSFCRGMHVWEKSAGTIYYFLVIHDDDNNTSKVYSSTNGTTWAAVNTLTNDGTSPVRFAEFLDATNGKKLVMVDGIEGYVFTSNAAGTKITDVDFPTPHVPFPVFLDGYLFLAKAGTGDIYNSDLNDPAIWTAGSFLSAEMYPDNVQALLKINNYLVAVGTQSTEYFYDAANATASPLARIEGYTMAFGTSFPNSIACSKDTAVFLANMNDGEACLQAIQGTKANTISCPFLADLTSHLNGSIGNNSATTAEYVRGYFIRQNGELFYVFTYNGETITSSASPTFMYSFTASIWSKASSSIGAGNFPLSFSAPATSTNTATYVAGYTLDSNNSGLARVFFGTLNPMSTFGVGTADCLDGVGTTYGTVSPVVITTMEDFGAMNKKFMSRLGIDMAGGMGYKIILSARDDSNSQYTALSWVRTLTSNLDFPFFTQLGSFRNRQFKIQFNGAGNVVTTPVRIYGFEVDINKGMQ